MNFIWCSVCTRNEEGIYYKTHEVARKHYDVGHFEYKSMQLWIFNNLTSSHSLHTDQIMCAFDHMHTSFHIEKPGSVRTQTHLRLAAGYWHAIDRCPTPDTHAHARHPRPTPMHAVKSTCNTISINIYCTNPNKQSGKFSWINFFLVFYNFTV